MLKAPVGEIDKISYPHGITKRHSFRSWPGPINVSGAPKNVLPMILGSIRFSFQEESLSEVWESFHIFVNQPPQTVQA